MQKVALFKKSTTQNMYTKKSEWNLAVQAYTVCIYKQIYAFSMHAKYI